MSYKALLVIQLSVICLLSYKLVFGVNNLRHTKKLRQQVKIQQIKLYNSEQQNLQLKQKIAVLKQSPYALEEFARTELGMLKKNERYIQIFDNVR